MMSFASLPSLCTWKANASSELPENIPVKIMNKSEVTL